MYGVVLDLPAEFREEIASHRQRSCPEAASRIFPHVTVKAPFTTEEPRTLAPALEEVAARSLPVQVRASGLASFSGPRGIILYVKIERTDELQALHEAVVNALPDVQNVFPHTAEQQLQNWVPHITLADALSEERYQELIGELREYQPWCEWEARELLLVRSESAPDSSLLWTTTRSFHPPGSR